MTLEIIGAGFGRTGTDSMKRALEMLGYGPCYHMYEVLPDQERYMTWQGIYDGRITPDWDVLFDGFRATVDWPAAHYWRELADHFPKAKILLTNRDPESWYASMDKTILTFMRDLEVTEGMAPRIRRDVFADIAHDRDHIIAVYKRNVEAVQKAFGPERLLTYELGSGWAPLCQFLGVETPAEPYPSGNDSTDFHVKNEEMSRQRENG
ncbi:MAG: sulfotransferase family protein [Arenibacterium sp.]